MLAADFRRNPLIEVRSQNISPFCSLKTRIGLELIILEYVHYVVLFFSKVNAYQVEKYFKYKMSVL